MNRNQFAFLLLALAVVGSAGLLLLKRNHQAWSAREAKAGDKVFSSFRFNDVAVIHVKSSAADFNVERKNGVWRVQEDGDYPANYSQIKDLLLRIREIKVVQPDTIGPSQLSRVGLEPPGGRAHNVVISGDSAATSEASRADTNSSATLVEFKDAGGMLLSALLIGKRHMRPESKSDPFRLHGLFDGCYIRLPSDPGNVLLISDELAAVAPEPQSWLSRDFFKIESPKSVSLISTNGANLWTLLRETESSLWSLSDASSEKGELLDKTAASQVVEILPFLTFVDVLPNRQESTKGLAKPVMLFVETFDNLFYTLKIGASARQGVRPVSVTIATGSSADVGKLHDKLIKERELVQWVYLVDSSMIQPLLRDRADLLQKTAPVGDNAPGTATSSLTIAR